MRTAITLGITKDGIAEIISHPKVAYHKQRAEFNTLSRGKGEKYVEIQFFPSKGRMLKRRFKQDQKGGVNYNAAHPVQAQQAKGKKKKKLPDLTPTEGTKGGVNMDASKRIDDQAKAKKSRKARTRRGGKKSIKKTGAHTTGAKVENAPAASSGGSDETSGPTL